MPREAAPSFQLKRRKSEDVEKMVWGGFPLKGQLAGAHQRGGGGGGGGEGGTWCLSLHWNERAGL